VVGEHRRIRSFIFPIHNVRLYLILQFYWASVSRPDVIDEMTEHYQKWKFKGIKLHQCWERFKIDSDLFSKIADFAERHELPIFIHLSSKRDVAALLDFTRKRPEVCIVVGHLIGLELFISARMNSYKCLFDLSPFPLISDYRILLALKHLGSERLVLGSDTPYGKDSLRKGIARIRALSISEEEKNRILGDNIARILKLDCA
jgi:uncharacterized protein